MSFGSKPKAQEIPDPVILPDQTDIAIKREQAKALKALLKRRGQGKTLLSGRTGDQSDTPVRKVEAMRSTTPQRSTTIMAGGTT